MNGWRTGYIRAFFGIIGIALIFVGTPLIRLLGQRAIGYLFIISGVVILVVVAFWWYKDFRQKQ